MFYPFLKYFRPVAIMCFALTTLTLSTSTSARSISFFDGKKPCDPLKGKYLVALENLKEAHGLSIESTPDFKVLQTATSSSIGRILNLIATNKLGNSIKADGQYSFRTGANSFVNNLHFTTSDGSITSDAALSTMIAQMKVSVPNMTNIEFQIRPAYSIPGEDSTLKEMISSTNPEEMFLKHYPSLSKLNIDAEDLTILEIDSKGLTINIELPYVFTNAHESAEPIAKAVNPILKTSMSFTAQDALLNQTIKFNNVPIPTAQYVETSHTIQYQGTSLATGETNQFSVRFLLKNEQSKIKVVATDSTPTPNGTFTGRISALVQFFKRAYPNLRTLEIEFNLNEVPEIARIIEQSDAETLLDQPYFQDLKLDGIAVDQVEIDGDGYYKDYRIVFDLLAN